MAKHTLKCAKPDEEDFEALRKLLYLENLFDGRGWYSSEEDWRDWDEDDEEYKLLKKCERRVKDMYDLDETDETFNDLILCDYVRLLFKDSPSSFRRVEMAAVMAMDNCFNPDIDYIDWRPDIQNAVDYYVNNKDMVEKWCAENVLPEEEVDCKTYCINKFWCENRNYNFNEETGDYTLDTGECEITFNFTPENVMMKIVKKEDGKSVCLRKNDLRVFDLRQNLRILGCEKTLEIVGTK